MKKSLSKVLECKNSPPGKNIFYLIVEDNIDPNIETKYCFVRANTYYQAICKGKVILSSNNKLKVFPNIKMYSNVKY